MPTFEETLARLATVPNEQLFARSWAWEASGQPIEARYALDRALEQEQDAAVRARSAWRGGDAARILGLAQLAFGDLRGLLLGVPDALLDPPPGPEGWSVRRTLAHAILAERMRLRSVRYAVERTETDPPLMPEQLRPAEDPADTAGGALDIVRRFAARRAETDAAIGALDEPALGRPTRWSGYSVDVRFLLHRFASHIVEHTIQCEKALEAAGHAPGDAPRAVRRISAARAMHERLSSPDVLDRLDGDHAAKADAIGA